MKNIPIFQCFRSVLLGLIILTALAASAGSPAAVEAAHSAQGSLGTSIYLPIAYFTPDPTWMGPDGGSVVCLKADPSNPNTVYAGTLSTGVYKSTNRGATWTSVSSGLGAMFIDSLEVDPKNSNIVYAGTHGAGVYKTTNGGASWFAVNNGIADHSVVYTIAVNPGNTDLVYAGTRIENTTYHGVTYKSTNGGASWSKVMDFSADWVYSIAVNPSEPWIVLAAVHTGGPVYSTDYGGKYSWTDANPPYFNDPYLADRWTKGRAVAFDPRYWMDRAFYTSWHDGMVSYSSNNGVDWNMAGGNLGDSHIYPNGISVTPGNPDVVYLAAHSSSVAGVLRSNNAGVSWYSDGLRGKTIYSVAALGGDTVLAGTYMDGLYRSDTGGASWYYSMSGISESYVTGMVFPGGSTVYASTKTGGGVFRSLDGGKTWSVFNSNLGDLNINGLVMHPTQHNILFALTNNAGLRRIDTNASSTWSPAGISSLLGVTPAPEKEGPFAPPPLPDDALAIEGEQPMLPSVTLGQADAAADAELTAVSAPVLALVFAPTNSSVAYLGTNGAGVYRSTDGGTSWTQAGLSGGVVRGITVAVDNDSLVYAVTSQTGSLKVSSNAGASWSSVALPDPSLSLYSIATFPGDPGAVYVGTSSGVYRYDGAAWSQAGLTGYQVRTLGYNKNMPNRLLAGTNSGAFQLVKDQQSWMPLSGWLTGYSISSLNFNENEPNVIYAGTSVRGTLRIVSP